MIAALSSCKMELDPYSDPTNRVTFVYDRFTSDTVINYSFAYYPEEMQQGVVTFQVTAIGFLSDKPRTVLIEQTNSADADAAKPGVHYQMAKEFVIPANATGVEVPVTLLRDESLETAEYVLDLSIVPSDDFQLGNSKRLSKSIVVTDILIKPDEWQGLSRAYLGHWGREKQKLMIEAGAEYDTVIDVQWLVDVVEANNYGLIVIWKGIFDAKLNEVNEALGEEGPLKEADGTIVSFDRVTS